MSTTLVSRHRLLPVGPTGPAVPDLSAHLRTHGPLRLPPGGDPAWRGAVARAVTEAGLVGRGGAGFPSGVKWGTVSHSRQRPTLVVNAMEGEPASAKDRHLLNRAPHLVLDGAEVVAEVVGASRIVVCLPDHADRSAASLGTAIGERSRAGSHRPVSVERPPGGYVTGEESALVGWLERGRALPSLRVDKSVPLTLARRPVLLHNTETLAQVALIARHGPSWFREAGTPDAPGTTLVTVSGAVRSPGVVEVELGTPVQEIVAWAGGGEDLSAVLIGGYGGAWLDRSRLDTPYAPAPLAGAGAAPGAGIVIALPATACGIAETARVARYMAGESAGQCGPCVFGLPALAGDLEALADGRADAGVLGRITGRADQIDGRGACRHPDGVVRLVRSALTVFGADAVDHALGRPCPGRGAATWLTFPRGPEGRTGGAS